MSDDLLQELRRHCLRGHAPFGPDDPGVREAVARLGARRAGPEDDALADCSWVPPGAPPFLRRALAVPPCIDTVGLATALLLSVVVQRVVTVGLRRAFRRWYYDEEESAVVRATIYALSFLCSALASRLVGRLHPAVQSPPALLMLAVYGWRYAMDAQLPDLVRTVVATTATTSPASTVTATPSSVASSSR